MIEDNTIFEAIDRFKVACAREGFSPSEISLFFALLEIWNKAMRPEVFRAWNSQLETLSGLNTDKTIKKARARILEAQVVYFHKEGNRGQPHYSLNALLEKESPFPIQGKATSKRQVNRPLQGKATSKRQVNGQSPQGKGKDIKGKGGSVSLNLPHGERFAHLWKQWETHRKELKKKLTPSTMRSQLKKLNSLSEAEAIATIERSIENGWTGLFPEKAKSSPYSQPEPKSIRTIV